MKESHLEIGRKGELLARNFLKEIDYNLLATNWRFKKSEIDIIAQDGSILVFVEVKTRTSNKFNLPEDAVSKQKERLISIAASAYMEEHKYDWEIRFDIVTVLIMRGQPPIIEHFKDAFFPIVK